MTDPSLPTAPDHVISTHFEAGEGVLIDLNAKRYYKLNETAMIVWLGIEQGRTLSEVTAEVTRRFEVSTERAQASVSRLLVDLEARSLLAAPAP